ncbi:hypothetical protein GCM10011375_04340 [Hymenobacter qilianensis]|uniref:Uncharacterized protein n=2 Tax=Hymenobacter qilianensis TaxID=1385715 RepID=A0ACB5PLZ9_9BACT|nr:hypothetical protein [Hymenobacter qilianensis]QNP53910.1 hypothetical protein H9L05_10500 [Hymenobacter qilianensis]GGF51997.1 hypothetical protein GCM10011375_04340 [Hymenobacter qilianensis]
MMIKSLRNLCIAATLSSLFGACQKYEGPTLAEGLVVEMRTEKPVPYAWIEVYAQAGSGLHSGYSSFAEPHQADANGRFSFSFDADKETTYILKAYSDKGHRSHWGREPYIENGHNNKGLQIPVAAPAWVKIRVAQQPDRLPDAITVSGPWFDQGYISTLDLRKTDYGKVSYHTIDSSMPNDNMWVHWEVNFGGQLTPYRQTFSVQPFDTAEVVVRY